MKKGILNGDWEWHLADARKWCIMITSKQKKGYGMEIIGERLRLLRTGRKLSQAKIAEMVGTVQSNINKYEAGKICPPPTTLLWYATFFHVSLDYIFGRTDNPQGFPLERQAEDQRDRPIRNEEVRQFVEMCFNPEHPMSDRLKTTIMRMLMENRQQY